MVSHMIRLTIMCVGWLTQGHKGDRQSDRHTDRGSDVVWTLGWKAPCRELKGPVGGSTGWMPGTEGAGYCGKNYTSQPHIHRERLVKTTLLRPLPHSSHHPPQMYKTNTPILEHVNINSQCFCRAPRSCHTSQTKR